MPQEMVSDKLWGLVDELLPPEPAMPKGGRPRVPARAACRYCCPTVAKRRHEHRGLFLCRYAVYLLTKGEPTSGLEPLASPHYE
jgi:hypothetical protein